MTDTIARALKPSNPGIRCPEGVAAPKDRLKITEAMVQVVLRLANFDRILGSET
jgi:hypothetical protein